MDITEFKANRKHFSKVGLIMFFGTLIVYAVQFIATAITSQIPVIYNNANLYFVTAMLPTYIIAYPLIFLMFKKIPVQLTSEKKKMKPLHIFIAFLIAYAGTYICNYIGTIMTTIIGFIKQSEVENVMVTLTGQINPLVNFLIVVIAAPIMEELLFRKFIIDRTAGYGEGVAIVLSGLMFGLFHGNINQFMYAFLLGVFFGFIYVKTRNIVYTIILHMFINFLGSFVSSLLLDISNYMELMEVLSVENATEELMTFLMDNAVGLIIFMLYAMILIGFVIAGIVLFFVNKRKFKLEQGEIIIEKGQRFKTIILNVGMILYCIFWIVMIVLQLIG